MYPWRIPAQLLILPKHFAMNTCINKCQKRAGSKGFLDVFSLIYDIMKISQTYKVYQTSTNSDLLVRYET